MIQIYHVYKTWFRVQTVCSERVRKILGTVSLCLGGVKGNLGKDVT